MTGLGLRSNGRSSGEDNPFAGLNPSQRAAVETVHGPVLVLAGAGTGKTRVITCRMAELIRRGVPADSILSVTFTNKAAKEMQERMKSLVAWRRGRPRPVVATFHSYCVQVLRQEITALGYPAKFVIYDRGDQEAAARKSLRHLKVTEQAMSPSDLVYQISRWKTAGIMAADAQSVAEDDLEVLAAIGYRRYQSQLKSCGAVDFDDLLLLTRQLFREHPEVLQRQQQRFEFVQIDEYQDTNELQFQIVSQLVAPHQNLCVVGDDDQSIYGWRGAEIRHILGFQQQFPTAKVVRLEDNYRCTDAIIQVANELVRYNRGRHEKSLVAHKSGPPVHFKPYPDEQAESEGVVREINYLVTQLHVDPTDIAILFRTNEQPRLFESELRRLRLPYTLIGGQSFFDRKEVRDVLAYLRAINWPDDEVSLLRIINVPSRGIGATALEKLVTRAVKSGKRLWDVVPAAVAAKEVTAKTAVALQQFRELLLDFQQRFSESGVPLSATCRELLEQIDYAAELKRQYPEPAQQLARQLGVDEVVSALKQYERQAERPELGEFLEQAALVGRDEVFGEDPATERPGIKLMTLHSAKGLEFPRVYLVGLEEGLLPHQRSVDAGTTSAIEEERRLCYVGVTRAREVLTVSWAMTRQKWGRVKPTIPSRFLREMQPDDEPSGDEKPA
jgi:DNA helicase II / ATP-dependent DNA helicase PcrA